MRPLRLQLRNFLSYGENVPPLSFDGMHVVCLSGPNGHGKSALLDAMTWALWGKARSRQDDDLIRHGATAMLVDFEFLLEDQRYRVRRERVRRRGRQGRTVLEFYVWDSHREDWRPLTETSVRDTQHRILQTLKLDYDTFITSAYLKQGRADRFTTMRPAERKAVLAEILRLDQYTTWEERARQQSRVLEARIQSIEHQIASLQEEIAREDSCRQALTEAEAELTELEQRLKTAEEQERLLNTQREMLLQAREEFRQQQARVKTLEADIAQAQAEKARVTSQLRQVEALLARRETIEAQYEEWQRLRAEEDAWNERLRQHVRLQEALREAQMAWNAAREQLTREISRLEQELSTLQQHLAAEATVQHQLAEAQERLTYLTQQEETLHTARERLQTLQEERAVLREQLKRLKQDMQELRERLDRLESARAEATCPLCGQPLTAVHLQQMVAQLEREGQAKKQAYTQGRERLQVVEQTIQQLQQEIRQLEARLKERTRWQRQHATAEATLESIQEAKARVQVVSQQLDTARSQLTNGTFAQKEQARLAEVQHALAELGYDAQAHEQVRQRLLSLADAETLYRQLQQAEERRQELQVRLTHIQEQIDRWHQRLTEERQALAAKQARLEALPDVEQAWRQQVATVEALSEEVARARTRLGALRQELVAIQQQKQRLQELTAQRQQAQRERAIYKDLAEAFGKRGLQAMIIEAVLPELEAETNRLLARMTDGRMSIQLKTQRARASGEGVIETLDIEIADELGVRPYELFSGGEAFRINFALRVALSKLLARRAGARLRSLFIDEGFGSQDAAGRLRLVDAINAIQEEFDLIVVITHIEELKDMFPVRIEVYKDAQGSSYTIT